MADNLPDPRAEATLKRFAVAQVERGTFEGQWEQIAQRVLPSYSGSFTGDTVTQGAPKTEEMVDATAALALPKFAAAMESMLTPRNSLWHTLVPQDPVLKRNRFVKMYYDDVTQALFRRRYNPNSNFAGQVHEGYMGLGAFGTAPLLVDALDKWYGGGLRYRAVHLGEVYFLENHQGIVDTAFRRFQLTARQAQQKFVGKPGAVGNLPDAILRCLDDPAKLETKFWFVNCVSPRDDYEPKRADYKGMRFSDCYIAEAGKVTVMERGFNTFPYPISRYMQAPGETYGRSPAMLALPAIKTLNEQMKTILTQGHRVINPVLLTHDDGVLDSFSLRPGAINPGGVTQEGKLLVHALPTGNLAIAKEMLTEGRAIINDSFLVTLFQILIETPQMTATEVLQRAQEKGALLSPTMGRQQSEFLGPLIERELDVLAQQNMLPPMPAILQQAKAEYDTVYSSPLSRAQRAEQATGLMRLVDWTKDYIAITQDLRPLDWINWDGAMPDLADIQAVPARWVNDIDQVMAIRGDRQQQQQAQQAVEAAPALAGAAKALPPDALKGLTNAAQ
jgi:hypothetical protein